MLGIGVDVTKISRFKAAKDAFIKKVLHPNEIVEYLSAKNKSKYLAGRWAIKEALFKANNKLFHFNKIEIITRNRIHTFPGYVITTSTEDDFYVAFVQKEK